MLKEFFYLAHMKNIGSIMASGILSRKAIIDGEISCIDISDQQVQRWRAMDEPVYQRSIHSYAPLYINPRNPMLYSKKHLANNLVILSISSDVLNTCEHVFTDGNAACVATKFSNSPEVMLPSLQVLMADYWNDFADGRRKRMAEVLIFPKIDSSFITGLHCHNTAVACELERKFGLPTIANSNYFF